MKKHLLHLFIASFLLMLFGVQQTMAQEEKTTTITITITEGDEVTTDTTFELEEGQDSEMIKKMVSHMAGEDMHVRHICKDIHVSHGGDHKMVWISEGGDHSTWHTESMMEDINIDSIKEAHGGGKVMVMKNADGKITVKELDEDMHGKHGEMMFIESDGDCQGKEKKIEVIIVGDEDMEWIEKDDGEEVKVIKKTVRVEIEEKGEMEKKEMKEEKEEKTKKKNKK